MPRDPRDPRDPRGETGVCTHGSRGTGLYLQQQANLGFYFYFLVFIIQFNTPGFHILKKFNNQDWYFPPICSYSLSQRFMHYWLSISFLPVAIPLKSELAYEIFDKGQVRFWLQAEHLSPDASYRFIINDREVSDSEVSSCASDLWLWGGRVGQWLRVNILRMFSSPFELQKLGCSGLVRWTRDGWFLGCLETGLG